MPKSLCVVRRIPDDADVNPSLLLLLVAPPPSEVLAAFAAGGPLALKHVDSLNLPPKQSYKSVSFTAVR